MSMDECGNRAIPGSTACPSPCLTVGTATHWALCADSSHPSEAGVELNNLSLGTPMYCFELDFEHCVCMLPT